MAKTKETLAAATALQLAEKTQATAEALAHAKVQSDIKIAEMSVDIGYIKADVKEIKDTLNKQAEIQKADPVQVLDHESRIRRLERWGLMAIGALFIIQFALQFINK